MYPESFRHACRFHVVDVEFIHEIGRIRIHVSEPVQHSSASVTFFENIRIDKKP